MTQLFDSFLTVGQQVLGLFVLVCVGVICGKKGILTQSAVRGCAELVLLFATPCVILQSFERENRPEMLLGLLFSGLAALAVHAPISLSAGKKPGNGCSGSASCFPMRGIWPFRFRKRCSGKTGCFTAPLMWRCSTWCFGATV